MSRSDEHRSRRLLVVDDERSIVPVIERFARQIGFDVEYRSNGRDALAALFTMNPDVAMVDLQMHEPTGIDVLRAADEAQVILMTAARLLGVSRRSLYRWLDGLEIDDPASL